MATAVKVAGMEVEGAQFKAAHLIRNGDQIIERDGCLLEVASVYRDPKGTVRLQLRGGMIQPTATFERDKLVAVIPATTPRPSGTCPRCDAPVNYDNYTRLSTCSAACGFETDEEYN